MMLQDPTNKQAADGASLPAASTPVGTAIPEQSRWCSNFKRRDGSRTIVRVVAIDDNDVMYVNEETGAEGTMRQRSLVNNYERIADAATVAKPASEPAGSIMTVSMRVSPSIAQMWLDDRNPPNHNRPYDKKLAASYAHEIFEGRWKMTHQGIAFTTDGKLDDGQHRLSACVMANKSIWVRVTYRSGSSVEQEIIQGNPPPEAIDYGIGGPIDCGKFRPAFVQVGLQGDRDFGRYRRIQGIVAALDVLEGRHEKMTAGHIEAVVARYGDSIDWATKTFSHRFPVAGPAAFVFARQRKDTRSKIDRLAEIINTRAWADDKNGNAFALYELMKGATREDSQAKRHVATGRVVNVKQDVMRKILRLVQAFCVGEKVSKSYATDLGVNYFSKKAA